MNTLIKVGDKIKCIKKSFSAHTPKTIIGEIYTVTALNGYGICLKETDSIHPAFLFDINRFKKITPNEEYPTLNPKFFSNQ